jgi:hypothetical protein
MIYYLLSNSSIVNNSDTDKKYLTTILYGTVIYIVLHAILNFNFKVLFDNIRIYFWLIVILDISVLYYNYNQNDSNKDIVNTIDNLRNKIKNYISSSATDQTKQTELTNDNQEQTNDNQEQTNKTEQTYSIQEEMNNLQEEMNSVQEGTKNQQEEMNNIEQSIDNIQPSLSTPINRIKNKSDGKKVKQKKTETRPETEPKLDIEPEFEPESELKNKNATKKHQLSDIMKYIDNKPNIINPEYNGDNDSSQLGFDSNDSGSELDFNINDFENSI